MIKINLAKGRSRGAKNSNDTTQMAALNTNDSSALRRTALTRLAVIILGPIMLLVYEQQAIPELKRENRAKQEQLNQLTAKNTKAAAAVQQTRKFKREQEILQAQIDSIESLKKDRLREVKVLDFLQKDLPEKLWLSRMELNDGKLNIQGMASSDAELTQFMDNLSRSAFLKEVSLVRSSDSTTPEYGAVKRFEISCLMEKAL